MRKIFLLSLCLCSINLLCAQMKIERVEPLSWWTDMRTPLQLMFYGKDLQNAEVRCLEKGLTVLRVHQAESKNYLFVDVLVDADAQSGIYTFEFTQGKKKINHQYLINARSEGSAQRKSFGSEDMIYLIMPDRFANGDPTNDSHKDAAEKADRSSPYGRHGGDIQGIINHLDYLQELGVTAIWCTPLLFDNEPDASYHGYACADYYRIDPRFGTNELYKQMADMARERQIKIIMDMVPNHCGMAHWWVNDLPFASWINQFPQFTRSNYQMASHFDPHASKYDNDLCIKGWFDTSMPDMNLTNPYVLTYFTQMAIWWIEYVGLDGLRVDTYPYSDKHAMAAWTKNILDEYPNLNIVGEAWYGSPLMIAYWEGAAKNADGYTSRLPSVMDFPLQESIAAGFVKDSMPSWNEGLMKIYSCLTQDFVYVRPNNLMIFADNHDINRMAWLLKGKKDKQKMVMALLATMRGVPQIYYGSEVMLYNKKERGHGEERLDMPGGWPSDERSVFTSEGRTKTENEVFEYTKKLFNWRKNAKVIHEGKLMQFVPVDNNFYVYFRYTDNELVMVAINNCRTEKTIDWPRFAEITADYSQGTDIITGESLRIGDFLVLPPQQAKVVHFKRYGQVGEQFYKWNLDRERTHNENRNDFTKLCVKTWNVDTSSLYRKLLEGKPLEGNPLINGVFPEPNYNLADSTFGGLGTSGEWDGFDLNNKKIIWRSFFVNQSNVNKEFIPNKPNEVFFTIVALTDTIESIDDFTLTSVDISSRNHPHYIGQGFIKTKTNKIDFISFITADRNAYAVVNMRLFDLRIGRIVLIAPQKDGTFRSLQHESPIMSSNETYKYIQDLLNGNKRIIDFFTQQDNI